MQLNEELLSVWLKLSTTVNNERVVSDIPFNESLIYNILYRNQQEHPDRKLTATDLCQATRILKSQMNRTLNSMEEKGFITRERSTEDKRQVYVTLNAKQAELYINQHAKILKVLDAIIDKMGQEKISQTIELLTQVTEVAAQILD